MQSVCSKHTRTHAYKHVHCDLNSKSYDLMFKWVKTFTKILLWLAVVIIVMFTILCRGLHTVSVSVSVCVVSYIQIWEACEKCKIVAQFKWSFRHVPEGYCCRCCCCRCCCCCFCCRLVLCNAVDCRKTAWFICLRCLHVLFSIAFMYLYCILCIYADFVMGIWRSGNRASW